MGVQKTLALPTGGRKARDAAKAPRYDFGFPVADLAGFSLAALSAFGVPLPEGAVSVEAVSVFWLSWPWC